MLIVGRVRMVMGDLTTSWNPLSNTGGSKNMVPLWSLHNDHLNHSS